MSPAPAGVRPRSSRMAGTRAEQGRQQQAVDREDGVDRGPRGQDPGADASSGGAGGWHGVVPRVGGGGGRGSVSCGDDAGRVESIRSTRRCYGRLPAAKRSGTHEESRGARRARRPPAGPPSATSPPPRGLAVDGVARLLRRRPGGPRDAGAGPGGRGRRWAGPGRTRPRSRCAAAGPASSASWSASGCATPSATPTSSRCSTASSTSSPGAGLAILLLPMTHDLDAPPAEQYRTSPMDAAVFATGGMPGDPALAVLTGRGVPVVSVEGPDGPGTSVVRVDDRAGTARGRAPPGRRSGTGTSPS